MHRNSRLKKSNEMQQYADIYLLLNYCTCFERPSRPSSGVHKAVVVAVWTAYGKVYTAIWNRLSIQIHNYLFNTDELSFDCDTSFVYSIIKDNEMNQNKIITDESQQG